MWNFAAAWPRNHILKGHLSSGQESLTRLYGRVCKSLRQGGVAAAIPADTIELDPTSSSAYINRGNAHLDAGCLDRAIADYSRAIELDPQSAIAYNNRGVTHAVAGEPRAAIDDYDRAVAIDPSNAGAHHNRGDAYRELGDCERAIADYTKALHWTRLVPTPIAIGRRPIRRAASGTSRSQTMTRRSSLIRTTLPLISDAGASAPGGANSLPQSPILRGRSKSARTSRPPITNAAMLISVRKTLPARLPITPRPWSLIRRLPGSCAQRSFRWSYAPVSRRGLRRQSPQRMTGRQ